MNQMYFRNTGSPKSTQIDFTPNGVVFEFHDDETKHTVTKTISYVELYTKANISAQAHEEFLDEVNALIQLKNERQTLAIKHGIELAGGGW